MRREFIEPIGRNDDRSHRNFSGLMKSNVVEPAVRRAHLILRADGFSTALERINSVAQSADARTMSLQYFETLKALGGSPATKFIFPMEFTALLRPFTDMATGGNRDQ